MSDIFLDSAALRAHARMIDEAARMCGEATSGATHIDMHDEVYGLLCTPLVLPILQPLQDAALKELKAGADATAHLAETLRAVSDDADMTDSNVAGRFQAGN